MRVAVWTKLLCLSLMPSAWAATFDCNNASTFVEKAICSDSRLTSMDDQLWRLYKDALAASSTSAALKAEQRAWLSSRDQCKDSDCIIKAYEDRNGSLSAISSPAKSGDFTGTYKAANGDVLVQQTPDGRIKFSIGATYRTNVGEVSGEAPLSGDAASYADKETDCGLSFKFAPGKLVVTQDGSCGMGLNVSASSAAPPNTTDNPRCGMVPQAGVPQGNHINRLESQTVVSACHVSKDISDAVANPAWPARVALLHCQQGCRWDVEFEGVHRRLPIKRPGA